MRERPFGIEPVPHRWRLVRAVVGDTVEVPTDAESVSLLPAEEDSDEVAVSFFVSDVTGEFNTELETESRPIEPETIGRDEPSRALFRHPPTIVPAPNGESTTVYFRSDRRGTTDAVVTGRGHFGDLSGDTNRPP